MSENCFYPYMRDIGLHMIGKGLENATFSEMLNPLSHAMSIIHIAHGTELIIKSRISEQHPLLIFSKLPKSQSIKGEELHYKDLIEFGQTLMYSELPERLWATTGYKIKNINLYNAFGNLRNQIMHFGIPDNVDFKDQALVFGFEFVENMINEWWDITLLDYTALYDPDYLIYAFEQIKRLNIKVNYRLSDDSTSIVKINEDQNI